MKLKINKNCTKKSRNKKNKEQTRKKTIHNKLRLKDEIENKYKFYIRVKKKNRNQKNNDQS
jgi:hypothetical protein